VIEARREHHNTTRSSSEEDTIKQDSNRYYFFNQHHFGIIWADESPLTNLRVQAKAVASSKVAAAVHFLRCFEELERYHSFLNWWSPRSSLK